MKRKWQVRRELVERADGQRRWDRAYQLILGWGMSAQTTEAIKQAMVVLPAMDPEEVCNESSCICARINTASSPTTDH